MLLICRLFTPHLKGRNNGVSPPETIMAPENRPLEVWRFRTWKPPFQVLTTLVSGRVFFLVPQALHKKEIPKTLDLPPLDAGLGRPSSWHGDRMKREHTFASDFSWRHLEEYSYTYIQIYIYISINIYHENLRVPQYPQFYPATPRNMEPISLN